MGKSDKVIVAVKRAVLDRLLEDPEFNRKLSQVKSNVEYAQLIREFCKKKRIHVKILA